MPLTVEEKFVKILSLVISMTLIASSAAYAKPHYAASVKSMKQDIVPSPKRKDKKLVHEGCGPIAVAMLLGYWQTERGKKKLLAKGFNGTKHPTNAIAKLYLELKSKKVPGKKKTMSYTMPNALFKGLKARGKTAGLKADRVKRLARWSKKKDALKEQLRKKNPVILLKNKEHKSGCLGEESAGRNLLKNLDNAHYFLAVGYEGNKVAIMPGFSEKDKSKSTDFSVHEKSRNKNSHAICTFEELKTAQVSLFWLE